MKAPIASRLDSLACLAALAVWGGQSAEAALLFYDGFSAGGATPGVGQYTTSPASTNGLNGDSLIRSAAGVGDGQAPSTPGFATGTGNGWRSADGTTSAIYPKLLSTGLSYAGMTSQAGSVDIFRAGSNSMPQLKNDSRFLGSGLGVGASDLYFSSLMQFDAGVRGQMGIIQGTTNILSFGFNDLGEVNVIGNASAILATTTGTSFTAGATYLLVAHVYSGNLVDIYLNPTDLTNETASSGQKVLSGVTLNGFVAGNAIADLRLTANTGNGITNPDFVFDEIHGATTWAEAFGASVIPEPGAVTLVGACGLLGLIRRRR